LRIEPAHIFFTQLTLHVRLAIIVICIAVLVSLGI